MGPVSWGAWWAWLLALYAAGYVWAFRWLLTIARRAYANPQSELWHWQEPKRIDALAATGTALGVVLLPLLWPLLWLARLGWTLITSGRPS